MISPLISVATGFRTCFLSDLPPDLPADLAPVLIADDRGEAGFCMTEDPNDLMVEKIELAGFNDDPAHQCAKT